MIQESIAILSDRTNFINQKDSELVIFFQVLKGRKSILPEPTAAFREILDVTAGIPGGKATNSYCIVDGEFICHSHLQTLLQQV